MSNLVIVAIPEEQDRVWKVSSEKVPHLTLLFLGDAENAPTEQIVQFVQHAVELSEHGQFYLDVDRRGILGDAEADVLFFSQRSWNLKWIKQFRGQLLQNHQVRTAYDSTPQHTAPQDWVPHLTMGYPNTPAKPLPDDGFMHPIYSVCFDRIAVWVDDYDGPEFRLEWPDREMEGDLAIAYSDTKKAELVHNAKNKILTPAERGAEFVEHHGVKGMKWGQRKDVSNSSGETAKVFFGGGLALLSPSFRRNVSPDTKLKVAFFGQYALLSPKVRQDLHEASKKTSLDKADNQWEKGLKDGSAHVAVNNKVADHFNANIGKLNAKHPGSEPFKGDTKDFDNPSTWGPKYKSYMKDIDKLTQDSIAHATNELHLKNPSGTQEVKVSSPSGIPGDYHLSVHNVQHAADDPTLDFTVKFTKDANGLVTGFTFPDDNEVNAVHSNTLDNGAAFVGGLVHGATSPTVDEFMLEHFGIKGMRWGHRKEPPTAVNAVATSKVPHGSRRKTKVETAGGENHPASDDALRVGQAQAKLRKSGPKALSNDELRDVANRIQLEEQVVNLNRSGSNRYIRKLFGAQGTQTINQLANEGRRKGFEKVASLASS